MNRWIVVAVAVIAILSVAFVIIAAIYPGFREASRDIAIVILAVLQMVSVVLSVALLVAILYTVRVLRDVSQTSLIPKVTELTVKVDQILENTTAVTSNVRSTSSNVASTTTYVTERTVAPIIRLSGVFAGVRAAAGYLARRGTPTDGEGL